MAVIEREIGTGISVRRERTSQLKNPDRDSGDGKKGFSCILGWIPGAPKRIFLAWTEMQVSLAVQLQVG